MTCSIRPHIRQPALRSRSLESTNQSLRDGGHEETPNKVSGTQRSNDKQRVHSIEGTRLDEHDDDGLAQPTDPRHPQGGASVPGVHNESDYDHEGEEGVERKRN